LEKSRPGSWKEHWNKLLGEQADDPALQVDSLEQLVKLFEEFRPLYDELAELAALPPAEFDATRPEFVARAKAANPVAAMLLPALDKVTEKQRHAEARMAMLLAGLAVVESGPEKLADLKDPFGDGPFGYRKLDGDAFELSSKLMQDGKPVTLVIGQPD
jgi:hypothetical protein